MNRPYEDIPRALSIKIANDSICYSTTAGISTTRIFCVTVQTVLVCQISLLAAIMKICMLHRAGFHVYIVALKGIISEHKRTCSLVVEHNPSPSSLNS